MGLSATVVYNWRVLWYLPQVQRKEHILHMFVERLRAHRARGMPYERWRSQFSFLGMRVCREAFTTLTGMGSSTLQVARGQALASNVPWSYCVEKSLTAA